MTLYVNGTKAATATNTTPVYDPDYPLTIGAITHPIVNPDGSPGSLPHVGFNGSIADVRAYNSAIGTNLAIGTPVILGPIASTATDWWNLADASNPTTDSARPSTDHTHDATLNGGATWTADTARATASNPSGTVLRLDGTTGYAATPDTASGVDTSKSYSVSAWVKLNSRAANSTFVSQSDSTATSNSLQLYYSSSKKSWAFDRCNDDTGCAVFTAAYGGTPTTNTWTHLTGVYDATAYTLTLYVDGHLAATTTYTGTSWNATGPVEIGRRVSAGTYGEYANGAVSDIHLYNTALPPADAADNNDTTTITQLD